jgi:hypothetical protein
MKNIKRLLFGALSTVLLTAGFANAATHFDPISNDLSGSTTEELHGTDSCTSGVCDANLD